jgi:FKBP-type peptidyl-prolyl cis-trans isomerase (trigger factor)
MDDFSDLFKVTIKSLEKLEKAEPNEDFFSKLTLPVASIL